MVLRAEPAALGSASQVSLALKDLQREGEQVRLGSGVYAKPSRDAGTGAVRPQADFETLAREAARKLKLAADSKAVNEAEAVQAPKDRSHSVVLDTGRHRDMAVLQG